LQDYAQEDHAHLHSNPDAKPPSPFSFSEARKEWFRTETGVNSVRQSKSNDRKRQTSSLPFESITLGIVQLENMVLFG
jgi:hypothetical protein